MQPGRRTRHARSRRELVDPHLLPRPQRAVPSALGTLKHARLGPDPPASADPEIPPCSGRQVISGHVQARPDTTLYAKPPQRDQCVGLHRLSVPDGLPTTVDVGEVWLMHVEAVGRPDAETDVAFEVAGVVFCPFLVWAVLREVLCRSHDKLELVVWVRHLLGIDDMVEVAVRRREMDEGFIVEACEDHSLKLHRELLKMRPHGYHCDVVGCGWCMRRKGQSSFSCGAGTVFGEW